jgi:remodeling and spacing factor 1
VSIITGCHTSCLKPEVHLVPEGAWFCPPCAHKHLVTALTSTLKELDRSVRKMQNQELRRQRLAYVGISLDNTLPARVSVS